MSWILFLFSTMKNTGFTQGQVPLVHPIVDSCLSVLRSGVWNVASRVKLLIHEAILKLNMPISISG